jgi:predicted O-linked N-acetylglucosamine transferase (SPINDLY family)
MLKWLTSKLNGRGSEQEKSPIAPEISAQWRTKGNICLGANNLLEAEQCYRKGIEVDPSDAICYSNLGYVLGELGRSVESRSMLLKAVELNPSDFDAQYILGNLSRDDGEWLEAIEHYKEALHARPDFELCRRDLCVSLAHAGQIDEARVVAKQGPAMDEDTVDFHYFTGNMHLAAGENAQASRCFEKALQKKPGDPSILLNLGAAQLKQQNPFAALETYRSMLALDINHAQTHAQIAAALQQGGQLELAIRSYQKALACNPGYLNVRQSLLYALTYSQHFDPAQYLVEAKRYGAIATARAKPYGDWLCTTRGETGRPLRVGFVSGDLRSHPVGAFLESILKNIDAGRLTCIAYSCGTTEDAVTQRLRCLFAEWVAVATLSDQKLAERIYTDRIDILIDLAGHTGLNRLPVFAWRPAPIQVSWLGYWASTGIAEMDYLLADKVSVRNEEDQYFSEKLLYLPDTRLCMSPPITEQPVDVSLLPSLRKGFVTFASFQILTKITDQNFSAWSKILARVPGARLRLQSLPLAFAEARTAIQQRLKSAGIEIERVDLFGGVPRAEYLASYADVDVVLDTYPFPGGTTTAEALWMGVPTVTLTGNTLLERQGESMLRCAGLADWVAKSEQEYIELAVNKVADLGQLGKLRAALRSTVLASPLFDGVRFARNLEDTLNCIARDR